MQEFRRMDRLPPYVFATVNEIKMEARHRGEEGMEPLFCQEFGPFRTDSFQRNQRPVQLGNFNQMPDGRRLFVAKVHRISHNNNVKGLIAFNCDNLIIGAP